jgi:hypothetical protein
MSFTVINSTKNLQVSTLRSSSLTATGIVTGSLTTDSFSNGRLTTKTVVGYAPASFAEAVSGDYAVLESADGVAVQLPAGAIIRSLLADNNDTPITSSGSGTYTVVTGIAAGSTVTSLLSGFAYTEVNSVAIADLPTNSAAAALVIPTVATPANNYLAVLVGTANNTAGSIRVFVTYSIIE